mgnify:CR=1 FL=1|tara:strand:- start:374 stop:823 length:450 start_codon:yes stop_codon:yes gene_type:complete
MNNPISNRDDVIDSRDVIARIEELEAEIADLTEAQETAAEAYAGNPNGNTAAALEAADDALDCPEAEELADLRSLAAEGADYAPDWHHGETMIRDSYFKAYAMELADEISPTDPNAAWPTNCIDWDQAARELRMDYSSIEFSGVTYWIR